MKGNNKVLKQLQKLLTGELAARDQYFTHARMYDDWGLTKLSEHTIHEMEEETQHADRLIQRILFLEGKPDLAEPRALNVGKDVEEMLRNDLAVECQVVAELRHAIKVCEQEHDYQSREVLEKLLDDTEEDHTYWLEKQLGLIEKIGLKNYLQSQM
ncbi:MAG: bacterioferritin [Chromatiales bacterium]|nr:bacterioferritin [Chromatiales bacterium]